LNIYELLELDPSADTEQIRARAADKKRYFNTLLQSAPTQVLRDIYARRIGDIEKFLAEHGGGQRAAPVSPPSSAVHSSHSPSSSGQGASYYLDPDNGRGGSVTLQPGLNIIGRQPRQMGTPIILDDTYVSANHAVVEVVPGPPLTVHVYDIGEIAAKPSTNGVYVNRNPKRIDRRIALNNGDHVRFGQTGFTLRLPAMQHFPAPVDNGRDDESLKTVIIKSPFR
jgi:FHA domain